MLVISVVLNGFEEQATEKNHKKKNPHSLENQKNKGQQKRCKYTYPSILKNRENDSPKGWKSLIKCIFKGWKSLVFYRF